MPRIPTTLASPRTAASLLGSAFLLGACLSVPDRPRAGAPDGGPGSQMPSTTLDASSPAACSVPGAFCDDLDDGVLDGGMLDLTEGGSGVLVAAPGRPGQALKLSSSAAKPAARALFRLPFSPARGTGTLYARARFLVAASGELRDTDYVLLIVADTFSADYEKISLDLEANDALTLVNNVLPEASGDSAGVLPRESWHCLALQIDIAAAGGSGRAQAFVDGQLVASTATGVQTLPATGFESIGLGSAPAAGIDEPVTVYLDDIAITSVPTACP
jgi:hypothetical protein